MNILNIQCVDMFFLKYLLTSWAHWVVWIVSDPLKLRGGREGLGDVSQVLEFLNINTSHSHDVT